MVTTPIASRETASIGKSSILTIRGAIFGYWGDHQIVYLLRLLESYERFYPGQLAGALGERLYATRWCHNVIRGFDELLVDPRNSIRFNASGT